MANVRNFSDFMNEASFQGNAGIPGEEGENKPSYLKRVERAAAERGQEFARNNRQDISGFMGLVMQARRLQEGKEEALEALAEKTVRDLFGSILDGVTLNIKFAKGDEIKNMMEESPDESASLPEIEELKDADIISAVQVRKLSNAIMQGSAKNTKLCLNLDDTFEGLVEIFGEEDAEKMRDLLTRITNVADFYDWNIPMEVQKEMWKTRNGFSGSVQVEWEESNEETEDLAKKVLDDLASGEDIVDNPDVEELFNETTPTVNALGTDFAMLLHEGVKGVYMLIAALSIPEDEEASSIVVGNTDSLADEIEDLRYGPQIEADFRDFVNELDTSRLPDNPQARVFGKLLEISQDLGEKKKFLRIFNGILLSRFDESELTEEQKNEVKKVYDFCQKLVDSIADELEEYYSQTQNQSEYEPGEYTIPNEPEEKSEYSEKELLKMADDALDRGDMEEFKRISAILANMSEAFTYTKRYRTFLNESVDAGKKYVVKKAIEDKLTREYRNDTEEELEQRVKDYIRTMAPEEEKQILDSDKDFQEIKNMLVKNPGLMVPFLKWKKEEGATIEFLKNQLDSYTGLNQLTSKVSADEYTNIPRYLLIKVRDCENKKSVTGKTFKFTYLTDISDESSVFLVKDKQTDQTPSLNVKDAFVSELSKAISCPIENISFVRIKEYNKDIESLAQKAETMQHIPGYERFGDKVRNIEKLRKGDWLRKSLPTSAGRILGKNVNLKKLFDESPESFKESMLNDAATLADYPEMIKIFNKKISAITSMEELREYLTRRLNALGSSAEKLLQDVERLSPGVECLYDDDNYVLISLRSEEAQKALCSAANWCINRGQFWNYAKGRLQFTIYNFQWPQTDDKYMLGFTCDADGTVYAAHNTSDDSVRGNSNEKYQELLRRLGFPKSIIAELDQMFKVEASIKGVTDSLYSGGSKSVDRIKVIIDNSLKQYLTATKSDDLLPAYQASSRIALRILVDDFLREPLRESEYSEILNSLKNLGIVIDQTYLIFKAIFPKPSEEIVSSVLAATNRQISRINEAVMKLRKEGNKTSETARKISRATDLVKAIEANILPKLNTDLENARKNA